MERVWHISFGSLKQIRDAEFEELCRGPGLDNRVERVILLESPKCSLLQALGLQ